MSEEETAEGVTRNFQADLMRRLTGTAPGAGDVGRSRQGMKPEDKLKAWHDKERIARPFMNGAGRECLALLRQRTIEQPTWPWQNVEAQRILAYGCAREGQNSIVRYIEDCIRAVEEGPPNVPQESESGEEENQ